MLEEKWEKALEKLEKFLGKMKKIDLWWMNAKDKFWAPEEDLEKHRMNRLGSRKKEFDYRKRQRRARDR